MFDLQLIDKSQILSAIKEYNFDIIGVSMTFGLFDVMKSLVNDILSIKPELKIVIGGSLAAIEYSEILNLFPKAIVSLGEGEKCMTQVVEWFLGERKISDVNDIAFLDNSGNFRNTNHDVTMQAMHLPEFDLLIATLNCKGVFQLETSRGCYNACSFCPRQHKGFWKPLVDNIEFLDQFLNLYRECLVLNNITVSAQTIYIVDEEFIGKECRENRIRTERICALFAKHGFHFEISFRMDAIFSLKTALKETLEKIYHVKEIHNCGLNRVLVGVESGVDNILERFNKNISTEENTQGIRLLTALGIPARFTYITFDPLMSFDELISTYFYQGRTDLIMSPKEPSEISLLLQHASSDECWSKHSIGIPFYYYIPYMLVSLECLIGSKYYMDLDKMGMLEESTIKSLGKKNARYLDDRIGILSHLSQLWIDRNFSLDYTLKSLGKIYPSAKSIEIREIRTKIKENSYRLLGKLIYLCMPEASIISNQPKTETDFIKNCIAMGIKVEKGDEFSKLFRILDFQFDILRTQVEDANSRLFTILNPDDYKSYQQHYCTWKDRHTWQLINYE